MKKIIIVGAGGFGREAFFIIKDINKIKPTWNVLGFLDDNKTSLIDEKIEVPILSKIDDWQPAEDEYFILGMASPKTKEFIAKKLRVKGAKFATIISPYALVNETAQIGEGCVITSFSSICDCSVIGSFVNVAGSIVGQDAIVGDFTTTTAYVNIAGVKVGKRCFIGSQSVILGNIEDDVEVVAGSTVFHKIKAGNKVMGYPAKRIVL